MAQMGQQGQQGQQGQTNQSTQPSGQALQLNDQDIMQIVLTETKHMAESLNTYILEANTEQLRRDYMTALGDVYSQQKQMYDIMQQQGYYDVKNASPQDIQQAKSKFSGQNQQGMQ